MQRLGSVRGNKVVSPCYMPTFSLFIGTKVEQKAKEGGASWLMRKMVKLKIGKGINKKGQSTYSVNGRNVTILSLNKKDKMHFELSEDGKKLTRTDKDKVYVLDRIK